MGRRKERENHSNPSMKGEGSDDRGDNGGYDCKGDRTAKGEVMEIASRLARENNAVDAQDLFSDHFRELLACAVWGSSSDEGAGIMEVDGKANLFFSFLVFSFFLFFSLLFLRGRWGRKKRRCMEAGYGRRGARIIVSA